jgi:hypothetical protein
VAGLVGLIVLWILGLTGVFDNGDAYGRLDLPGAKVLRFPKGQVDVSFETQLAANGGEGGGGLTVPALSLGVTPADGRGPDPVVVESYGSTVTVNADAHERVWKMTVGTAGDYRVTASGALGSYTDPQLTFGHEASLGPLVELAFVIFLGGLLSAIAAGRIAKRAARAGGLTPATGAPQTISGVPGHATSVLARSATRPPVNPAPAAPTVADPSPEDAVLMRLDKLANLHERGALTDAEFAAEKSRILDR